MLGVLGTSHRETPETVGGLAKTDLADNTHDAARIHCQVEAGEPLRAERLPSQ